MTSPRLGVVEEEAEEWGLRHASRLHTKHLYFSMSYKLGFMERFQLGKEFFLKKQKQNKTENHRSRQSLLIPFSEHSINYK